MSQQHDRNAVESAAILALAFRAGLFNRQKGEERFAAQPATLRLDLGKGFDVAVCDLKSGKFLLVDVTGSHKYKGRKIARATNKLKRPSRGGKKRWGFRFIAKGDWQSAAFDIGISPCFLKSFNRISDGEPIALSEACPEHGNSCEFAHHLFDFGEALNRQFAKHRRRDGSPGDAVDFAMDVKPPF